MKGIKTSMIAVVLITALVVYFIGDKILAYLNLTIRNMEFEYINDNKKTQRWVDYITPLAKQVGTIKGIPWQAIVVQTAIETGWGKSSLFRKYNNYGGIKAVGSQPFVTLPTIEYYNGVKTNVNSKFRKWDTKYDGLMGYADFFHVNKRYATALKYPNDPYKFIEEIKKAGYATDPNYVSKLHGMLNKYFG